MDWRAADLAAVLAEREGTAAGLRDAAVLSLMSDALLRVSEASAADVADVARMSDGSGTLTVLRSKTDQEGRGHVRYLGAATVTRIAAYLERAGHDAGALFRRVRRGDHPAPASSSSPTNDLRRSRGKNRARLRERNRRRSSNRLCGHGALLDMLDMAAFDYRAQQRAGLGAAAITSGVYNRVSDPPCPSASPPAFRRHPVASCGASIPAKLPHDPRHFRHPGVYRVYLSAQMVHYLTSRCRLLVRVYPLCPPAINESVQSPEVSASRRLVVVTEDRLPVGFCGSRMQRSVDVLGDEKCQVIKGFALPDRIIDLGKISIS